jgi:hypothetical protein
MDQSDLNFIVSFSAGGWIMAASSEMHFVFCNAGVEAVRCLFKVADTSMPEPGGIPTSAPRIQPSEPCTDAAMGTNHKVGSLT